MYDENDYHENTIGASGGGGKRLRHSLRSGDGEPGGKKWRTWADVPLVLTILELAIVLQVSRATAYAAVSDGTIPCFRVRGSLRCTRVTAWAMANGQNPWDFVGQNPFASENLDPALR